MSQTIDGRYELLEVIASGGMATVWRARDLRLRRLVAVKRPHPAPRDEIRDERLAREARVAASLSHPNLVTVFDSGRDDEGLYLVMELIDGPTLAEVGSLDRRRSVEVAAQVADALAAVHAAGIVHRDVKPANILMAERGPVLTDFGIAVDEESTARLTQDGTVFATPNYAAPEVLRGGPVTPKTDVYALAMVVYQLIGGKLPDRDGVPPSLGDPDLDPVLRSSLSDDPDRRPDAAQVAAALRGSTPTLVLPGAPAGPRDTEPVISATDPRRQRSKDGAWWVAAAALSGVALLASLATVGATPASLDLTTTESTEATDRTSTTTVPVPSALGDPVEEARDELEDALSEAHPSDFNPSEIRRTMEKVDEAIEDAREGDLATAATALREVRDDIEEHLHGLVEDVALDGLEELAGELGIDLDEDDEDED